MSTKNINKKIWLLLIFLIISIVNWTSNKPKKENLPSSDSAIDAVQQTIESSQSSSSQTYIVKRVLDGDTIELENGEKVRYIGIDTPETVKPNTAVQCYGKIASAKNKELVEGKQVRLEKDVSNTDKFGRLLRYVYVGDIFVNEYLVSEGYAKSATFPPDVKYQEVFKNAETSARENMRGLWGSCPK